MENKIEKLKKYASETILAEARAVCTLPEVVGDSFAEAVSVLADAKGRIVVSGVGKSAIVARKMVATLNSTGDRGGISAFGRCGARGYGPDCSGRCRTFHIKKRKY